jgi:hypothetical protein
MIQPRCLTFLIEKMKSVKSCARLLVAARGELGSGGWRRGSIVHTWRNFKDREGVGSDLF